MHERKCCPTCGVSSAPTGSTVQSRATLALDALVASAGTLAAALPAPRTATVAPHLLYTSPKKIRLIRSWILLEIAFRGPGDRTNLFGRIHEGLGCEPSTLDGGFKTHFSQLLEEGVIVVKRDPQPRYHLTEDGRNLVEEARPQIVKFLGLDRDAEALQRISDLNQAASAHEPAPKMAFVGERQRISPARFFVLVDHFWHGPSTREESRQRLAQILGLRIDAVFLRKQVELLKTQGYVVTQAGRLSLTETGRGLAARGIAQWAGFLGCQLPLPQPVPAEAPLVRTPDPPPRDARAITNDLLMWDGPGELSHRSLLIAMELQLRGGATTKTMAERLAGRFPVMMHEQLVYGLLRAMAERKLLDQSRKTMPGSRKPSYFYMISKDWTSSKRRSSFNLIFLALRVFVWVNLHSFTAPGACTSGFSV